MSTICLCMIVKNEAHVIRRCLESIKDRIDTWVIHDTGSTDDTISVIHEVMEGKPGKLYSVGWVDFATNRTSSLECARASLSDYSLVVDADDYIEPGEFGELTADVYSMPIKYGSMSYHRNQLFKNTKPWRYDGVVHEAAVCSEDVTVASLSVPVYRVVGGGGRSSNPDKYRSDAEVLKRYLNANPNATREAFYLAQSYRDAGMFDDAYLAYSRRSIMPGWDEENFYSMYQQALIADQLGFGRMKVVDLYTVAYMSRPTRAEPLCALARYYRNQSMHHLAHMVARQAFSIPRPNDVLFVDDSVYEWRCEDELVSAAFNTGNVKNARQMAAIMVASGCLPANEEVRVRANITAATLVLKDEFEY